MARTAQETAIILKKLYRKEFGEDYLAPFRLTWEQLRGIAGVRRFSVDFLEEVNGILQAGDYSLLTLNSFSSLQRREISAIPGFLPPGWLSSIWSMQKRRTMRMKVRSRWRANRS